MKEESAESEPRVKPESLRHKKTLPIIGRVFIVGPRRLELLTFRV